MPRRIVSGGAVDGPSASCPPDPVPGMYAYSKQQRLKPASMPKINP